MLTTFDAALSWVDQGYSVIPIGYKDKRPAFDALGWVGSYGDEGRPSWETYKNRQPRRDELETWFHAGPPHNLGIVTGYNNLVVIDFDVLAAYDLWHEWAWETGGEPWQCVNFAYTVTTARGRHVYVRPETCCDSYMAGCIDVKARWGYVLAPPSIHPSGALYAGGDGNVFPVGNVGDVFPLKPDPTPVLAHTVPAGDPYDAATEARDCGGMGVIAAIKERVTIADVLGLTKGARVIRCPLHNDRSPSFYIYSDGHFKCFGCGAHGDVLDLVAMLRHVSQRDAIVMLAEQAGIRRGL